MESERQKICPYVQNQTLVEENYTYTEEGQIRTFKKHEMSTNAICVRSDCAAWKDGRCCYINI